MDTGKKLLTVREMAAYLSVSELYVYRHAHDLPCIRIGRLLRFDLSKLGACNGVSISTRKNMGY